MTRHAKKIHMIRFVHRSAGDGVILTEPGVSVLSFAIRSLASAQRRRMAPRIASSSSGEAE